MLCRWSAHVHANTKPCYSSALPCADVVAHALLVSSAVCSCSRGDFLLGKLGAACSRRLQPVTACAWKGQCGMFDSSYRPCKRIQQQ